MISLRRVCLLVAAPALLVGVWTGATVPIGWPDSRPTYRVPGTDYTAPTRTAPLTTPATAAAPERGPRVAPTGREPTPPSTYGPIPPTTSSPAPQTTSAAPPSSVETPSPDPSTPPPSTTTAPTSSPQPEPPSVEVGLGPP